MFWTPISNKYVISVKILLLSTSYDRLKKAEKRKTKDKEREDEYNTKEAIHIFCGNAYPGASVCGMWQAEIRRA
jgi:hypothetical protein